MTGALAYLTARSIRNSLLLRLRRLRQPRYLLVGLGLAIYLASIISSRWRGPLRIPDNYEALARLVAALGFFATMVASWILPASGSLRFTLAEVSILFPAPIGRRQLLQYKIVRLMLAAAGGSLFFTLFFGPLRPASAALFAFKITVVFIVIGLVEAGVALYRVNAKASSGASARLRLPILTSSVLLMALAAWVLSVFAFADSIRTLMRVIPVIALLFFACVAWILWSDAAFEEEAAINADRMREALVRFQKGQPRITPRRRGTPFRLAPTGPPEFAILWKNWLLFGRASRSWITTLWIVVVVFVGAFYGIERSSEDSPVHWKEMTPILLLVLAGAVALMGPTMVRSDLRRDLAHLVVIKTWPVRGAAIVRGEVLAPAIALTLGALAAIVPAALFAPPFVLPAVSLAGRLAFGAAAITTAAALIVTQLVIQNAIVVTFPAWVRPRAVGAAAGVELMGQMMIVLYGGLFVLALAALAPAAAAALVMFFFGGVLLPAVVFASLLFVESFAATEIIGRVLERTDLQDVG